MHLETTVLTRHTSLNTAQFLLYEKLKIQINRKISQIIKNREADLFQVCVGGGKRWREE